MATQLIDHYPGLNTLRGFDSIILEEKGQAIEPATLHQISASGQNTTFQVRLVNRQEDLAELLRIDARASIKLGPRFRASAKLNILQQTRITSFAADLFIYVVVENAESQVNLTSLKFTPEAKNLYDNNFSQFETSFGDSFIYGQVTGGICLIRISLQSDDSKTIDSFNLEVNASGGLGMFSASAFANIYKQIQQTVSQFTLTASISRQGTNDALPSPNDINGAIDYALNFPTKVSSTGAVPLSWMVMPYKDQFSSANSMMNRLNQVESLNNLSMLRLKLISNAEDYAYAIANPEMFTAISPAEMQQEYDKLVNAKEEMERMAERCFNNSAECQSPAASMIELTKATIIKLKNPHNMNSTGIGSIEQSHYDYATFCKVKGLDPTFSSSSIWAPCDGRSILGSQLERNGGGSSAPDCRGIFPRYANETDVPGAPQIDPKWRNEDNLKGGEKQDYALIRHQHLYLKPHQNSLQNNQHIFHIYKVDNPGYGQPYYDNTTTVDDFAGSVNWSNFEVRPKNMTFYAYIRIN